MACFAPLAIPPRWPRRCFGCTVRPSFGHAWGGQHERPCFAVTRGMRWFVASFRPASSRPPSAAPCWWKPKRGDVQRSIATVIAPEPTLGVFQAVARLRRFVLPHWRAIVLALVLMLGQAAMELLKPWPLKLTFDAILKRGDL